MAFPLHPYCGTPPMPSELWLRWRLDPILLAVLFALAWLYARRSVGLRPSQRWSFYAGWLLLSLALVSPLCPLSVSLFSARVTQHTIITLVAAPLLVLGGYERLLGRGARFVDLIHARPIAAAAGFAACMWFWHAPRIYAATFNGPYLYWAMHVSLIATSLMLWSALLQTRLERAWAVLCAGVFSTVQMSVLGAVLTFADRAWYFPHLFTTFTWGLSPLTDQRIGGLVMWTPGCAVFLAAALMPLLMLLHENTEAPAGARLHDLSL